MKLVARSTVPSHPGYMHVGYLATVQMVPSAWMWLGFLLVFAGVSMAIGQVVHHVFSRHNNADRRAVAQPASAVESPVRAKSRAGLFFCLVWLFLIVVGLAMAKLAPATYDYSGRWMQGGREASEIAKALNEYAAAHGEFPTLVNAHFAEMRAAGVPVKDLYERSYFTEDNFTVNSSASGFTIGVKSNFDNESYSLDDQGRGVGIAEHEPSGHFFSIPVNKP